MRPAVVDGNIAARLTQCMPYCRWDVVNQAHAHTLSGSVAAAPFDSLEHAMACWPETATAVGLRLEVDGNLCVVAPWGLHDLFDLVLRPSPLLRNPDAFQQRARDKGFLVRWPRLRVRNS